MKKAKTTVKKSGYYTPERIAEFIDMMHFYRDQIRAGKKLKVTISRGNEKEGLIPSASLLPFVTCPACCASTCGASCYAAKIAAFRKSVAKSYAKNTALALYDTARFWEMVERAAALTTVFRFHVSGDIINADYFAHVLKIARTHKNTKILLFTKKYDVVNAYINGGGKIPKNLKVIFSGWGADLIPENPHGLPESTVYTDKAPDGAKICGGNCETCFLQGRGCWNIKNGETIAFKKH